MMEFLFPGIICEMPLAEYVLVQDIFQTTPSRKKHQTKSVFHWAKLTFNKSKKQTPPPFFLKCHQRDFLTLAFTQ